MIESKNLEPLRYEKISLRKDSSGRAHHAIIFDIEIDLDPDLHFFEAKCRLPQWMTWTPTGHGSLSNWDLVTNDESEQIQEGELALLIPRSLWTWYIPRFIRNFPSLDPKNLFLLKPRLKLSCISGIDDASNKFVKGQISKEDFDEYHGVYNEQRLLKIRTT